MKRAANHVLHILVVLLLGTFLSATLVRLAPGYGVDENDLNSSLSAETRLALRQVRTSQQSTTGFYIDFYRQLLHGSLGQSVSMQQSVRDLLTDRIPVTARSLGMALLIAWSLALVCAAPSLFSSLRIGSAFASCIAGVVLAAPAAVLALVCLLAQLPASMAVGLVVFPRVYQFARNILLRSVALPHVLAARARGAGSVRVLVRHVLPSAAPQLLALVGISACIAFGACIPIEALCDIPGIGQLAWKAALSRDLTLLLNLTMIVTVFTLAANSGSDLAISLLREHRA